MAKKNYSRILRAVQKSPWAILPEKLAEITDFLRIKGADLEFLENDNPPEPKAVVTTDRARKPQMVGSIAVIPVFGTIAPRMNMFLQFSGGTSSEMLKAQIRQAAEDDSVQGIVLDIDSPGGSVYGIPEVAEEVFQAREKKPIVAVANPIAASAAYYIASAASEVVVTPSGEVGSIGVIFIHEDYSEQDKMLGIKTTLIKAGKYKGEANPWEPLSKEDREELQRLAEILYRDFLQSVARGRNLKVPQVREEFGQGRMVLAKEALAKRMVDRIETMDRVLERMKSPQARARIGKKNAELTAREFEAEIREHFGFSRDQAKAVALHGFKELDSRDETGSSEDNAEPRDEAAAAQTEPRDEAASVVEKAILSFSLLISAYAEELRSRNQ